MVDEDTLTRKEFNDFMGSFTQELNQALKYLYQRFDDVDRDLKNLKSTIHSVKNDTKVIPPMFELVRMDTTEIGELKLRIDSLESDPKQSK